MGEKITAIIVEDSKDAVKNLKRAIADAAPEVDVVGEEGSVAAAAKLIEEKDPQIVFLDVDLQDGTGFEVLDLLPDSQSAAIVFTTGSEEHAIKAFRYAAVDYLLKPIDIDDLQEAVYRATHIHLSTSEMKELFSEKDEEGLPTRMALHTAEEIIVTKISEIVRCQSYDNYCNVILTNNRKVLISKPLKHFDNLLAPLKFIRVHQSHLVNLEHIDKYIKQEGGYLILKDGTNIPVSMRKRRDVVRALAGE